MLSLDEDSCECYRSLPPTSISSLEQFHTAFNKHCQRYYSSELFFHKCCKECKDYVQGVVVSKKSCEDEGYEDECYEEEEDDLAKSTCQPASTLCQRHSTMCEQYV
jgi:hypothetical protein